MAHLLPKIAAGLALLALGSCGALTPASSGPEKKTDDIFEAEEIGLITEPLVGPIESIDGYCADLKKEKLKCAGSVQSVDEGFEPPYEAVEVIRIEPRGKGTAFCEVAVATDQGWFISDQLFICGEPSSDVEAELINLELVAQKDGPPIVRAELRTSVTQGLDALMSESLVLCGVGSSGAVSCTEPFSRLEHVLHQDGAEEHRAVSMTLSRFGVIKVNGEALVDGEIRDISGAYRIRFE